MTDLLNFAMLICAAVGSMAFGVLGAYWMFKAFFWLMRPRTKQAVAVRSAQEAVL
jgi:hypothetical protein